MARTVHLLEKSTGREFPLGRFNEGKRSRDMMLRRVRGRCHFIRGLQCVTDYQVVVEAAGEKPEESYEFLVLLKTVWGSDYEQQADS